ncbi:MAG: para-aminobenzoate synthetase / 4-amino-4-deoxychorismate lyase [Solirubrobacterales bacterium]|nr:para-aminobenzoate synthetase / 4-amino-4-deoxychorismate lyase [Solirubrobacterales bacterium]
MATSDWRPDPAKGVFETLLVVGGEPMEATGHLARLGRSLAEIYGVELPSGAGELVRATAAGVELGRLRVTAVPRAEVVDLDLEARPVDRAIMFPTSGAALRQVERAGGHGQHKWVDRRGMEHPEAGPGQLICDGEELLEAGWANLFAVREGTLWTPAADGRILAGMARAALLEIAAAEGLETREQPLHAADLLGADETLLTNSVRGIEPAASLDGTPLPGSGPISRRLADALRRRWGLANDSGDPQGPAAARQPGQLSR